MQLTKSSLGKYIKMINELKELHKMAFGDSDEYVDFFFNNRYSARYSYVQKDASGSIVSVAYARMIDLKINKHSIQIPFLNGIATHNNYRHKGYARKVIDMALNDLKSQALPFVLLHPFKHEFYKNLNFETISYADKATVQTALPLYKIDEKKDINTFILNEDKYEITKVDYSSIEKISNIYQNQANQFIAYNNRDLKEWTNIITEHLSDYGYGYLIYKNKEPICYILLYQDHSIREVVSSDYSILSHVSNFTEKSYTTFFKQVNEYTMGTILSVEKALYYLPFKDNISKELTIECGGNQYLLNINSGKVQSSKKISKSNDKNSLNLSECSILKIIFGLSNLLSLPNVDLSIFKSFSLFLFDTY